ncbi:TPA: major capsid protein, partial [Escherichia coli]
MSMYTTAQLLAANEQKFKFDPLFLRLFFRESYPFTTEKVYLSQIPGLVNMALYVSPIVSGEVIRSRGGSTSEFTPGYVKPKHEVNPQMTLRRLPDEDPQNLADPAYRRRRIILQNMRDEELAIAQVEEMQAVSAVLKGKYTMTGEAFDPVEVDTMPQASSIVYIALIGGAGYNVGSPQQAGISELVLRAGNGNPKGITGALWKRTAVGLTNFAWINTSGDTYDIYVEIGNYATSVNIHWDCTTNASVSIYTSPTYSASKPSSVTDGVVYTMYSSHQKPTPSDIGALPTTGGTISGPLSVTDGITGALKGNADTATKLAAAPKINGVKFDGSADINLTPENIGAFARRSTGAYADSDGAVP